MYDLSIFNSMNYLVINEYYFKDYDGIFSNSLQSAFIFYFL